MAMTQAGFVLLSMPKTGSTALQGHFGRHAQVVVRNPPGMKHMTASTFEQMFTPWFERLGFPRTSYETTCLVRHPVDRARSWWRYRSRPELAGKRNYTGAMSFDEFAARLVDGRVALGTAHNFVSDATGSVIVDRVYRHESLTQASAWMAGRLGIAAPELAGVNTSPEREGTLSAGVRSRLEQHLAADLVIYESAR
ncbi:MAG: sulfotransferase family 2 domain-containing protein [Nocardioides sp.]|nr:sulfotransferase family 2 domain-containing protein [Nocardioides sp.]